MIALNINKPKACLECPCLWTLTTNPDISNNKKYAVRFCAAKRKDICSYEMINKKPLPTSWVNFQIPDWCPLIDINNIKLEYNILNGGEY